MLKTFIKRNALLITFTLILSLTIVTIVFLFKKELLYEQFLFSRKESIAFLFKSFEISIILIASLFAYFRFFKGHFFLSKINYEINHKKIELGKTNRYHFFDIEISNIGEFSIFNPLIVANIYTIPDGGAAEKVVIKNGYPFVNEKLKVSNNVLRAKTTTSYCFEKSVDNSDVKALRIEVIIEHGGRKWNKTIIVDNL